ncbi:MAG: Rieske 2Fe-2S domain-containing protein [Verrucomicrobiota bacterium]|nr:Rieske 2Fe-2S domain-containing protein [Verrucomicrobiota bacterium]
MKKAGAVVIGGIATLIPAGAGFVVLTDPLRRGSGEANAVRVTTLESLPGDGIPQKFSILASRTDAWNRYPNAPIGAIYLRKSGDKVQALNVVCPHAGCFVDFRAAAKHFFCPCHNSSFGLDGKIQDASSPSPRGLDELEVEIRNGNEVWVKFQNFHTGTAEKIPVT